MANKHVYLLLNGAPYSGKSTIAPMFSMRFRQHLLTSHRDAFAGPLKHFVATALGIKYKEAKKDVELAVLQGYSIRRFLIELSEDYIKPNFGEDIYGRWLEHRTLRLDPIPDFIIIDDLGFPDEMAVLHPRIIVRVTRPNCTFANDSRDYIVSPDYEIDNNSTIAELSTKVYDIADAIVARTNRLRD